MPSVRRGSVFLIAMAVVTVMVVMAYGLLAVTRNGYVGARTSNLGMLAQAAARMGTAHANAVIDREFLAGPASAGALPGLPSTLRAGWRQAFMPIDTYRTGKETAAVDDDHPVGQEDSPEDQNDNDSKTENLLTELYCAVPGMAHAGYFKRADKFRDGFYLHPGSGRYIEPGYYNRDLLGKPVSFHLARDPTTHHLAAKPADPDPAAARGENWGVDVNDPLWLDGDLRPAPSRATARYRLRYAIAVEDLSGHLLMTPQGPWTTGIAGAGTAACNDADAQATAEIDVAAANRNADAFANMIWGTWAVHGTGNSATCSNPWWAWLSMKGWGAEPLCAEQKLYWSDSYNVLRSFASGYAREAKMGPDYRVDQVDTIEGTLAYAARGPAMSFETAQNSNLGNNTTTRQIAYVFTPFGLAGRPVGAATPAAWDDAYVDTPWRINLITATPFTLRKMLYAYLPEEFHTLKVIHEAWACTGVHGGRMSTETQTLNVSEAHLRERIDLFSSAASHAAFFTHLGGVPYPGSRPEQGGQDWRSDLGAGIDENNQAGFANQEWTRTAPSVVWGQDTTYLAFIRYYHKSNYPQAATVGATRERWDMPDDATSVLDDNFWYKDSYWLDLASAFAHTMAATQYAWLGESGASSDSNPTLGRTMWPTPWPDGDAACAALAGKPTLDTDRDGDGTPDSPSYLASVEQVDRQFLKNLGEWPGDFATGSRPSTPHVGLLSMRNHSSYDYQPATLTTYATSANIRSLLGAGTITAVQADLMELVVNDMRMSFFGSSPQYPGFTPLDLDDNGTVRCSCYAATGSAPADAASGRGPVPPGDRRFSLTGNFVMQKSRYYRIFVRGEVYDCLRQLPVASSDLETVYHVDPDGELFDLYDRPKPGAAKPLRSETLFQRWLLNRYQGNRARNQ